jgi:class 3 adenylate cyclase
VLRFGGVVAKYMGDAVLVYFGYSQAHEDDAERAVTRRPCFDHTGALDVPATDAVLYTPSMLTRVAEAYARLGQPVEGVNCLAEAAQIIDATNERICEADVYCVRGDLLNAAGDQAAAEQSYRQALVVARRQSAKLWEVHANTGLARLWRDQGKRDEARELLARVRLVY